MMRCDGRYYDTNSNPSKYYRFWKVSKEDQEFSDLLKKANKELKEIIEYMRRELEEKNSNSDSISSKVSKLDMILEKVVVTQEVYRKRLESIEKHQEIFKKKLEIVDEEDDAHLIGKTEFLHTYCNDLNSRLSKLEDIHDTTNHHRIRL
jgi:hypothetical protein